MQTVGPGEKSVLREVILHKMYHTPKAQNTPLFTELNCGRCGSEYIFRIRTKMYMCQNCGLILQESAA